MSWVWSVNECMWWFVERNQIIVEVEDSPYVLRPQSADPRRLMIAALTFPFLA